MVEFTYLPLSPLLILSRVSSVTFETNVLLSRGSITMVIMKSNIRRLHLLSNIVDEEFDD
jgi:hypothetical protein